MATSTSLTIGSQGTELLCTASWNRGAFIRAIGSGTVFVRAPSTARVRACGARDVTREHSGVLGVEMKTLPVN